jgi:hypothetical protein
MTTLNQIEEVVIMQMRALDPRVSVEAAQALNVLKLHLINQYHNEQLVKYAELLIRPTILQRIVLWFNQSRKA